MCSSDLKHQRSRSSEYQRQVEPTPGFLESQPEATMSYREESKVLRAHPDGPRQRAVELARQRAKPIGWIAVELSGV